MSGSTSPAPSPFRQPRAVYAAGFACVISFMGIGLSDPILPALASRLKASPAQVELLFTSYLVLAGAVLLATVRTALDAADAAGTGPDAAAGPDGQPGQVPVPGHVRVVQAGQSATVTSVPLTVTTAAGVDASRHRV